jgi:O-acetyl-ADP-ribose deacetylase (regulator of RNase III)
MIRKIEGNLLNLQDGILVHGCNCQGVMGGGIALLVRNKWPTAYQAYRAQYELNGLMLGDVVSVGAEHWQTNSSVMRHLEGIAPDLPGKLIVVNAMTQDDFGNNPESVYVDYDAILAAFARVRLLARDSGLEVNFPLIGCGLARGKWEEVAARIEAVMGSDIACNLWVLPS